MRQLYLFSLFLLIAVPCRSARWLELYAKVTDVKDGNNLRVIDQRGTVHLVRLSGSDAPELMQPCGKEVRDRLRELVLKKQVRIVHRYFDERGRILGKVFIDKTWANKTLVQEGLAWFGDPDGDCPELADVERLARDKKLGLWKRGTPIPPWYWRRGSRFPRAVGEYERPVSKFPRAQSSNERKIIGYP